MKKALFALFISTTALCVISCASFREGKNYAELSKSEAFGHYFPKSSVSLQFDTIDEAYDFINTARAKLSMSVNKYRAKGLAAKLVGPSVNKDMKITVAYFVTADSNDLSKETEGLEDILNSAISVSNVFLVFYGEKGTAISDFYLKSGYQYNNNAQYETFSFGGSQYKTDYPVGWGIDSAFKYLNNETE
jgi:hypothetical protein